LNDVMAASQHAFMLQSRPSVTVALPIRFIRIAAPPGSATDISHQAQCHTSSSPLACARVASLERFTQIRPRLKGILQSTVCPLQSSRNQVCRDHLEQGVGDDFTISMYSRCSSVNSVQRQLGHANDPIHRHACS
jgi:hypothetical protein